MITYVNTVLVGKNKGVVASSIADATSKNTASVDAFKFIVTDAAGKVLDKTTAANAKEIKIGLVSNKNIECVNHKSGEVKYKPVVKWSNIIKKADIKSYNKLEYAEDTQDKVEIDLTGATIADLKGKRIVVRLTFKDLPTRFRKWTESYEYCVKDADTLETIAKNIAFEINKQYKRARVVATVEASKIILTAMQYDDDDMVDSISPANTVRFTATIWMTDPNSAGFEAKNKYAISGAVVTKTPGKIYAASAKLVRDLEANAMGYLGILNRGECTFPVIKPEMNVDLDAHYNAITLEFENMYRSADDLFRKTKQAVNIFDTKTQIDALAEILDAFVSGTAAAIASVEP